MALEQLAFSYIDPKQGKVIHFPAQIADVFLNPVMENNLAGKNISKIRKGRSSSSQLLYLLWAFKE